VIPRLGDNPASPFPPNGQALRDPDGLLAWGGDLHPERLLNAYRHGIFPWYSENDPILWWSPACRCVFDTNAVHVSRRLRRQLRHCNWTLTADLAFDQVVEGCAVSRESTWIMPEMAAAYRQLHELGHAHSFELWDEETLIGGLYGVAIGRMFFGESMYSARSNASKVILARGCPVLARWGFEWMDCQIPNPHLLRMGARPMDREAFMQGLALKVQRPGLTGPWSERFAAALDEQRA